MPKPVQKSARRLKIPPKPKRSSDPNLAAHAQIAEHMKRLGDTPPVNDFQAQYKAHMAKLGAKGGKLSGAARMEKMTSKQRREVALKAAKARWGKPSDKK